MEPLKKNITVAAVLSAETVDTSGEVLVVKNADISALKSGNAPVNIEHINPEDLEKEEDKDFKGFTVVVGRVIDAKKIFSEDDCDNEYELKAWNDLQVPLIFGYIEFFDGDDAHENAKAASSIIKMANKSGFDHMIGFSVEGQILKREGNKLVETVIKRVASTLKPANKAAKIYGVSQDTTSNGDNGLVKKADLDCLNVLSKPIPLNNWTIVQDFGLSNALFKLRKALTAGIPMSAPSGLSDGAALQKESHVAKKLINLVGKKPVNKKLIKKLLPTASESETEKILDLLKRIRLKKHEEDSKKAFESLIKIGKK